MSLLAAAAVGVTAGVAVDKFIFNYTKNEYEEKLNQLTRLVSDLDVHLRQMRTLQSNVPSFWDDEQGVQIYQALSKTIDETEREMETVRAYIRTLQTVVDQLDNSKSLLSETAQDLMAAINSGAKV